MPRVPVELRVPGERWAGLLGVSDQLLKARFQAGCLVGMDQPTRPCTIQSLSGQSIDLFGFFNITGSYRFTNLANMGPHVRSNRTIPGSMVLVLL